MQKKDDKVGNKTAYEEERLVRMREKKELFNYVRSVGNYAFFLTKLIFSYSYVN